MPDTVTLARRDGVELIRTGRWSISTGEWTASRDDLAAAVAAMSCPAVRKPVLKVGHTDTRFTPPAGDGEPAIGWIDNLRLADGGHTLLGDYVGVPAWLDSVMASAYPDRSVEGSYNHRCQLGHTHPFTLTGVALLGVTPPGVGTLRSLNSLDDVKALYGLTAGADNTPGVDEVRIAASVPGAVLKAAADDDPPVHTGAMVALIPRPEDAERLAVEGGEPAGELHVTLAYLGDAAEFTPKAQASVIDAVRRSITDMPTIDGQAFAVSVFNPPGMDASDGRDRDTCIVLGVGGDDLDYVQALAASAARHAALQYGVELPAQHRPWVPHMTLTYTDQLDQVTALTDRCGPVVFDRVRVAFAGQHTDIPLTAVPDWMPATDLPVAAAADHNQLKDYWLHGEGLKKWATSPHPWTALYKHLRKHVDPERAKRIASEWFHEHFGYWPGSKEHRKVAAADKPGEDTMPNPQPPSLAERIHRAWNATAKPEQQWIVEAAPDEVIVMDNTDRSLVRVPVTVDGDDIQFGDPQRVRPAYVPADEAVAAGRMVFASAEESRPVPPAEPAADPAPAGDPTDPAGQPAPADPATGDPAPELPAAEPEPTTDPKEDPVSDLSEVCSRLGLADDARPDAILAAVEALKAKADNPTPDPAKVAAATAANDEMKTEIARLSGELASIKASAAADAKKALFDGAVQTGRIKPADREGWEARYDRAPDVISEILASLAPNTEVPVAASGYTGQADPLADDLTAFEADMARLDGVPAGGN